MISITVNSNVESFLGEMAADANVYASLDLYTDKLLSALVAEFPGQQVEVDAAEIAYTSVYADDGETTGIVYEIADRVWSEFSWFVPIAA